MGTNHLHNTISGLSLYSPYWLKYTYAHGASRSCLTCRHGLGEWIQVQEIENLIGEKPDITRTDLQAVRLYIIHSEAISEAL